jgi:hypothetical protein
LTQIGYHRRILLSEGLVKLKKSHMMWLGGTDYFWIAFTETEVKGGKEKKKTRHLLLVFRGVYLAHLDPRCAWICHVCFGWCVWLHPIFILRRQAYSAYLDPWCVGICHVYFGWSSRYVPRLLSKEFCVSIRLVASLKGTPKASQASREGGCGVVGWQGLKMDSGDIADLMPRFTRRPSGVEDNAFPRRGGWWGLARQDDLRYVIIKSKVVSLICIYVYVIS